MSEKPPVLMLAKRPSDWLLDHLADEFDLVRTPASGITAAVTGGSDGIDAATMDRLPDLRLVAVCAVGYESVDLGAASARGIAVTNTPDVLTADVADLAVTLAVAVRRRVVQVDGYVRAGRWPIEGAPPLARRFAGCRFGIVGLGRIGSAIARRVEAFDCEVRYYARSERADAPWRHVPDLHDLARWADVLAVAVPGGSATEGLISAAVIDALGPGGILVNVARGSVVDEPALVAALGDGRLGGAGLDVFRDEPHVPQALLEMENVVLQPHQGSATRETRGAMAELVRGNLRAHFAGRPLLTPVTA